MQEPFSKDIHPHEDEVVSCSEEEKVLSREIDSCVSQELEADSLLTLGSELHEDSAWPL